MAIRGIAVVGTNFFWALGKKRYWVREKNQLRIIIILWISFNKLMMSENKQPYPPAHTSPKNYYHMSEVRSSRLAFLSTTVLRRHHPLIIQANKLVPHTSHHFCLLVSKEMSNLSYAQLSQRGHELMWIFADCLNTHRWNSLPGDSIKYLLKCCQGWWRKGRNSCALLQLSQLKRVSSGTFCSHPHSHHHTLLL